MKATNKLFLATAATSVLAASTTANAASLAVEFQATIASEQHPDYGGEARFYHVSVNSNNPGIGSFAATNVGTNNPASVFTRPFTEDVVGYKWVGGTNNSISGVSLSGGEDNRIVYATQDTSFDGFGQNQLKFWNATDPGASIATGGADPFNVVADANPSGYRSFGGATGVVDISGLFAGSFYIFYGAFNATPSVSAVLKDTDGSAPDIVITNAHLNGDAANRTEYYVAELDFVTDGVYDTLEFEHLANGTDYSGNGRGLGSLLTGSESPPPELSLRVDTTTGEITLIGDDAETVTIDYYEVLSAGNSLDTSGWNSLADQDYDGNGPANGSGDGWEEAGGSGPQAIGEGYLLGDSTIGVDEVINLGTAYDTAVDTQDLIFSYLNDQDKRIQGLVEYFASALPGDTDGDGDIDDSDLGTSFANYTGPVGAAGGKTAAQGDTDGDGDVDDSDLGTSFAGYTGPQGPANVPEPTSLALIGLSSFAILRRRR